MVVETVVVVDVVPPVFLSTLITPINAVTSHLDGEEGARWLVGSHWHVAIK